MKWRIFYSVALLSAFALTISCTTTDLVARSESAYGTVFHCTYKNEQPNTGHVVYRAASDYFWVTEYKNGHFVIQKHYLIDLDTNEHRLMAVKQIPDGTIEPVKEGT